MNKVFMFLSILWFFSSAEAGIVMLEGKMVSSSVSPNVHEYCASTYSIRDVAHVDALIYCANFYFRNPGFDVPSGSFNIVIDFYLAYAAKAPYDIEAYSHLLWLYYSQWSNQYWDPYEYRYHDPEQILKNMDEIFEQGEKIFRSRPEWLPEYYFETAIVYQPLIRYLPNYTTKVLELFERAEKLSMNKNFKIKTMSSIVRVYYTLKNIEMASEWIKKF